MQHHCVIIVGAGPSGLSVAACLTRRSIPFIILEKDDCFASLWNKYSYDRLHFHLRKQFCELPHMSFPQSYPYEPFVPAVEGLGGFKGRVIHSTEFKSGEEFKDEHVLVVGSGNSGMEIALDLANHGARTSILIRSSVHLLSREMANLGLTLLKYLPLNIVDSLLVILSKMIYGDVSKFGIKRPQEGPFFLKVKYGKYPVFDVGTFQKIKSGEIQVIQEEIESLEGNEVAFKNGGSQPFDTIVFCTGFKRSTHKWLKGDDYLLNDDGIPKLNYPNHWKGKNGSDLLLRNQKLTVSVHVYESLGESCNDIHACVYGSVFGDN
ncbi:hypothetical protein K1719_008864 [Acacia pycnantha]|nr:hypothetical protein K1719_008864 [Acacia pycnantha]